LSRYEVLDLGNDIISKNLVVVRWRGFIPPAFIRDMFLAIRKEGFKSKIRVNGTHNGDVDMEGSSTLDPDEKEKRWFSMSAQAFGGKHAWTVMQFAGRETLVWEMES
jgi:ribonuclease P/MRP protein subunit RPP40